MALILIGIAVIVCLFIIFGEPTAVVVEGPVIPILPEEKVIPVKKSDPLPLLLFGVILLIIIALIVYIALKEHHHHKKSRNDTEKQG